MFVIIILMDNISTRRTYESYFIIDYIKRDYHRESTFLVKQF